VSVRRGAPGARRALTHVGGPTELDGDPGAAALLARALAAAEDPDAGRAHVHGFHSYPARLHPGVARALVEGLSSPGGAVLDPFCGSGTVLVEARLAGRRAWGVDANPLAVRLSELKSSGRSGAHGAALLARAADVADVAEARRRGRAGASRPYPRDEFDAFDSHVLLELDGLRVGLASLDDGPVRRDLELVLSSLVTKLGRRAGDSSDAPVAKRLAAGYATRLFVKKTHELVELLRAFREALPPGAPAAVVREGDARQIAPLGLPELALVLTSPPYPGTYDYLHHHALRLRWLGLDAEAFDRREIGARRRLNELPFAEAVAQWEADLGAVLAPLGRRLGPGGSMVLVMADSVLAGRAFDSERSVRRVAARAGLRLGARASQPRPHFHGPTRRAYGGGRPRREHALWLRHDALAGAGGRA
jgi:SAM-dependent methyltransferase